MKAMKTKGGPRAASGAKRRTPSRVPGREKGATAPDVDTYLAALPGPIRATLQELRRAIRAAAPEAEEVISYQIPTYRYRGALVHFTAKGGRGSLIMVDKALAKAFERDLRDHDVSGTTVHFSAESPLPAALVRRIVEARVAANAARAGARAQ